MCCFSARTGPFQKGNYKRKMRIVAAYLLASLAGKKAPDEAAINKILGSVGIEADAARVKQLIAELQGKNLADVIAAGTAKLSSVPSGGAAAAAPAAAPAAAGKEEKGGKKEEKKEAKKEEPKEEEEEGDMGFGLFD